MPVSQGLDPKNKITSQEPQDIPVADVRERCIDQCHKDQPVKVVGLFNYSTDQWEKGPYIYSAGGELLSLCLEDLDNCLPDCDPVATCSEPLVSEVKFNKIVYSESDSNVLGADIISGANLPLAIEGPLPLVYNNLTDATCTICPIAKLDVTVGSENKFDACSVYIESDFDVNSTFFSSEWELITPVATIISGTDLTAVGKGFLNSQISLPKTKAGPCQSITLGGDFRFSDFSCGSSIVSDRTRLLHLSSSLTLCLEGSVPSGSRRTFQYFYKDRVGRPLVESLVFVDVSDPCHPGHCKGVKLEGESGLWAWIGGPTARSLPLQEATVEICEDANGIPIVDSCGYLQRTIEYPDRSRYWDPRCLSVLSGLTEISYNEFEACARLYRTNE